MDPLLQVADARFKLKLPRPPKSPRSLLRQVSADPLLLAMFKNLVQDYDMWGFAMAATHEFGWPGEYFQSINEVK
jgi:hypothetical protein